MIKRYKIIDERIRSFNCTLNVGEIVECSHIVGGSPGKVCVKGSEVFGEVTFNVTIIKDFPELFEEIEAKSKLDEYREFVDEHADYQDVENMYSVGVWDCMEKANEAIKEIQENKKISIEQAKDMLDETNLRIDDYKESEILKNWQKEGWVKK